MGRSFIAMMLIASLLACPLRCFSCQTGAASDVDCATTVCSCCHDSGKTENPTDAPSDDCSCPNCICEGATIQADLEIPDRISQFVSFTHWSVSTDDDVLGITAQRSLNPGASPPCSLYGRDTLIAYQSWLI